MNYLAHAYLSFDDPEILVGNLISDFVKGKKKFDYPEAIQKGITLHRAIDSFTDTHEATKQAKNIFRPAYRLYSGPFVDVAYDHFLATDANEFTEKALDDFAERVYEILDDHINQLPSAFARMFPYMKIQNWLYNYRTKWGTESSFRNIVRRSLYINEAETAISLFEEHYKLLRGYYQMFFPELKLFAHRMYQDMIKF